MMVKVYRGVSLIHASCAVIQLLSVIAVVCGTGQVSISVPSGGGDDHGPNHVEVEQDTTLRLLCSVPSEAVTWYRDNGRIDASKDVILRKVAGDGHQHELIIKEAESEHAGNYSCRADNVSSAEYITVHIISHKPVTVTTPNVRVSAGAELSLSCMADIHADIAWFFDGKQLSTTDNAVEFRETTDESAHSKTLTLVRRRATAADHGIYTCRHRHHDHDQSAQANVIVEGESSAGHHSLQLLQLPLVVACVMSTAFIAAQQLL